MSLLSNSAFLVVLLPAILLAACAGKPRVAPVVSGFDALHSHDTLRVCSDPNNLPYSNRQEEGLENRIAALLAAEMDLPLQYTWWAQRRGFVRNTLRAGRCDLIVGVPSSFELAATTRPYYRSGYVFVYRADLPTPVRSFDDPALRTLRIGVPLIGDDGANAPPAHAFARRGIVSNVRGYPVYGDYSLPDPPARIIEAVARSEIDVAVAWGPTAAFFARKQPGDLVIVPVTPAIDPPFMPFVFDIAMGVRRGDEAFAARIDGIVQDLRPQIDSILAAYGVPRLDQANLAVSH